MGIENCPIKKALESMSEDDDKKMQQEMLLQLHEQYAVNNNAKLESAVSLIVGLIAVIGAYGYVFLHTSIKKGETELLNSKPEFTILSLMLTSTAALIVLAIMKHICMYQGFAQRKGQFIIYAIRCKYRLNIKCDDGKRIFTDTYQPYGKNGLEIYQGLFGEFIKIFTIIQYIILISIIYILCIYDKDCIKGNNIVICSIVIFIAIFISSLLYSGYQQCKDTSEYEELCNDYKELKTYRIKLNNTLFYKLLKNKKRYD